VDRQVLGLLVTPIKQELKSATPARLLQGLAFGIFYTLLESRRRLADLATGATW
jgi:hypothetical protein